MPLDPPARSTTPNGPSRLSDDEKRAALARIHARIPWDRGTVYAAEVAQEKQAAEQSRRRYKVGKAAARLWRDRGHRYQECRLDTFVLSGDPQVRKAQSRVQEELTIYGSDLAGHVAGGMGLVLTGPKGTGKDHLMAAMMHVAIREGLTVTWRSGLRLFAQMRADMDSHHSEVVRWREYTRPDVLAISDPSWEGIPLTDQQRRYLGAIVDIRCDNRRPIWITINATGTDDAERLLGGATVDRLRDGALSLTCNWASYRKSITTLRPGPPG